MLWLLGAAVVGVGALLAFQPLLNAPAGVAAGHPIHGALLSVLVSTITLAMAASLLIDHLGWPGVPGRPVDLVRGLGVSRLAIGVVLIR